MKDIQRHEETMDGMTKHDEGGWVRYAAHITDKTAALAEKDEPRLCKSDGGCRFMEKPTRLGDVFCGWWHSAIDAEVDGCNRWEAACAGEK